MAASTLDNSPRTGSVCPALGHGGQSKLWALAQSPRQCRLKSRQGPAPCLPSALGILFHKPENPVSLAALEWGGRALGPLSLGQVPRWLAFSRPLEMEKVTGSCCLKWSTAERAAIQVLGPAWPPGFSAASVSLNQPRLACL